jgi:lysyl oxidase
MRDLRRAGAIVAATALLWVVGVSAASADPVVGSLREGQPAFWSGAFVANARVSDPSLCGIQGPCFDYGIRVVPAKAKVLRVAINTPDDSNGWELRLLDPSGHEAASGSTYTLNGVAENFDVEVFAHDPAPGVWTAQVIPQNVSEGTFSARAAVQGSAKRSKVRRRTRRVAAMPPDLAPDPPWHVTFEQPPPMVVVEGGNYTAMAGVHNPTMQVANQPIYRCLPEETIEQGAQRCLRFTSGFASLGPGPFEVYGASDTPVAVNGGPLYQVISRSDGSSYSRPAGRYEFHRIHMHYHVLGIAQFTLYRVEPGRPLVPAGKVLKEGFCLGNIKLYDWRSFAQAEVDPKSVDNCEPSPQPDGTWRFYEGIANGWEDAYKWQTSGQYVDFANDSNGYYVLRVTVNPDHLMLETRYTNNTAYTYFQVNGTDVRVIERGHGTDPWDPRKTTVDPVMTH